MSEKDKHQKLYNKCMERIEPSSVFLVISLLGIILFWLIAPFLGLRGFDWLIMENNSDWAGLDYTRHIIYAQNREKTYEIAGAVFPPLAYCAYCYIAKITDCAEFSLNMKELLQEPYQLLIFTLYSMIGILLLAGAVDELKISKFKKRVLLICLLFSAPCFAGAFERGNSALYVIAFLLLAIIWKDSDNRYKREAALLLIAVCAGIKIYPAFMGLFYLKEKRYKEAFRLIVYGGLFFFAPFLFFGGIDGVKGYWNIMTNSMGQDYFGRIQFFGGILSLLGTISGNWTQCFNFIFLLILLLGVLFSKSRLRSYAFVAAAMAFFPTNAFRYTLLFFLLPVFELFLSTEKRKVQCIDALFLGLLFSIPTVFGILTKFELSFGLHTMTYVEVYLYVIAWGYLAYTVVCELLCRIKNIQGRNNRKGNGVVQEKEAI